MNSFEKLKNEFDELLRDYEDGKLAFTTTTHLATELNLREVKLFYSALTDIFENVSLPGNRHLILQEVLDHPLDRKIVLDSSISVTKLLRIRAILAGILQNVDKKELHEFAMRGDAGYSRLRLDMINHVVENEQKGIDYTDTHSL